jgi:hypothetical protein
VWARSKEDRANKELKAEQQQRSSGDAKLEDVSNSDENLLLESLVLQIGLLRSRSSLIQRFAVRCEAFDAARLRTLADQKTGRPEALLTLELARYLFDHGMHPLLDSTVSGLRPDIFDPMRGPSLYVEAKQYKDKNPRAKIKENYSQVWSTWARVRKTAPCDEAFLVVFRRSGPLVDLPKVARHDGLKLYSVVVDISEEGGSREKQKVVSLSEAEVRPQS